MRKFKDNQGREWVVSINISQARALREFGIDILGDAEALVTLGNDPFTATDALYVLCKRQCEAAGITDEQFGEGLAGDAFEEAITALMEELVDFFPKRQREALKKILATLTTTKIQATAMAERKIDGPELATTLTAILTQAEAEIDKQLAALTAGASSGNAPAQPA